jgi:hypothetical protein
MGVTLISLDVALFERLKRMIADRSPTKVGENLEKLRKKHPILAK